MSARQPCDPIPALMERRPVVLRPTLSGGLPLSSFNHSLFGKPSKNFSAKLP